MEKLLKNTLRCQDKMRVINYYDIFIRIRIQIREKITEGKKKVKLK